MLKQALWALSKTNASNSITLRLKIKDLPGQFALIAKTVGEQGGNLGGIDLVRQGKGYKVRDLNVDTTDPKHADDIVNAVKTLPGVEVVNVSDRTFLMHLGGKLEVKGKLPLKNRDDLSMAYTPGVARICLAIAEDKRKAWNLTIKKNTVAVVSDGTAVLGLGDIGPEAAMPVMEGKAQLFKEFGGVDAFPICINTKDPEEIIKIVKALEPTFGGINLEDISAPRCFEIERRLKKEMSIPIFHDDQHGTAIVVGAAFHNAIRLTKKDPASLKTVVCGVGASGTACTNMLLRMGIKNVIGVDSKGAISSKRKDLNAEKQEYLKRTNPHDEHGTIHDVIKGADFFLGLSGPNVISIEDLKNMRAKPMIFAMSNPTPEIMPEDAAPYALIIATGRSDYPNQINNVLAFPGMFRGALDVQASDITEEMMYAAAIAIAEVISEDELDAEYIVPSIFLPGLSVRVAEAVAKAAIKSGVARSKVDKNS
jgi:malate dehydrogenase (oxaloacetate-decarboxylating)